jgi:hypothetical protein
LTEKEILCSQKRFLKLRWAAYRIHLNINLRPYLRPSQWQNYLSVNQFKVCWTCSDDILWRKSVSNVYVALWVYKQLCMVLNPKSKDYFSFIPFFLYLYSWFHCYPYEVITFFDDSHTTRLRANTQSTSPLCLTARNWTNESQKRQPSRVDLFEFVTLELSFSNIKFSL